MIGLTTLVNFEFRIIQSYDHFSSGFPKQKKFSETTQPKKLKKNIGVQAKITYVTISAQIIEII